MRFATLLVALLVVGCSDIIEPRPPTPPPIGPPEPVPELPAMTLKGPDAVTPGDAPMYKAGQFPEGVTYRFVINDAQPVLIDANDSNRDRFFFTEVVGEGRAELRVTAVDENGTEIAFARKWIDSRY